ncbi:hypothetical protein [Acinetobacter sp.]|uniref:hypothetical protein n=1 Tax=Acinetobacter sp. TaxID=472 RepID=UPI0031D68AF2
MKRKNHKPKAEAVLVPAEVLAQLQCAEFYDRSTGDVNRMVCKIPQMKDFIIGDDLKPVANLLRNFYGLDFEQAEVAASYLAAQPNVRAKAERQARAEARRANNENSWAGWKPSTRSY